MFRLRIFVADGPINSSCLTQFNGQVEDYSLVVQETPVFGCTDPTMPNFNPAANRNDGSCSTGSPSTWFRDADFDGFGIASTTQVSLTQPLGYVSNSLDCNDNDNRVNPLAQELCDGIDNDCNGIIDNGGLSFYLDNDGDGFGSNTSIQGCSAPAGYVSNNSDCDDNNASINPLANESCNGMDDNCDGQVDEGFPLQIWYLDEDLDGFGSSMFIMSCAQPTGYVNRTGDCDDNNAAVNPDATEVCNPLDDNCNGLLNEGIPTQTWFVDLDGDGYGIDITTTSCFQPEGTAAQGGDCDDNNPAINPGTPEVCNNMDENCNGIPDDGVATQTWFPDNDQDGFGSNLGIESCFQPTGHVAQSGDCDDNNPFVNPGIAEGCNAVDDNCDGQIDEGLDVILYFEDNDQDGFGDPQTVFESCQQGLAGFVTEGNDCDDTNPEINPDATEVVNNGVDEDCDGMDLVSSLHNLGNKMVNVFPNPATDLINIQVDGGQLTFVANLYGLDGKLIKSTTNEDKFIIDLVPTGTYLFEVKDLKSGQRITEKIVIMR